MTRLTDPARPDGKCGGKTRAGGACGRPAGWGTPHAGTGACKLHAGSTPGAMRRHERLTVEAAVADVVARWDVPDDVTVSDLVTAELRRSAGVLHFLDGQVAALTDDELRMSVTKVERDAAGMVVSEVSEARPNVWWSMWEEERRRAREIVKTAAAIGFEDRRIELAAEQTRIVAARIEGALAELGVLDDPRAPEVVRRHLMAPVEATAAEVVL